MSQPAQQATPAQAAAHRKKWRLRIRRMLKPLPRRGNIGRYPVLKHIKHWFKPFPFLWSYRAPHWTRALYLGSVVTFLPIMGGQILVGAVLALVFRANLPIVAALQFVSNPLTGPVMYFLSYWVGGQLARALHMHDLGWAGDAAVKLSLGGLVCGLVLGGLIHLSVWAYRARHRHFDVVATDSAA